MKPLETCQRTLTYVSVCPAEENTSKWKKLLFKVFPLIIIATVLSGLIASIWFIWKFISTELEKCLGALYQIAGLVGLLNTIIVTFLTRRKLLAMFESLQKIYSRISDGERFQYLAEANIRTEWAWELFKKISAIGIADCCIAMQAISVLLLVINDKPFEFDSVYHTYYHVLPYRDTPVGYFFEICYSVDLLFVYLFETGVELILFISVCWHHQAFYQIFRHTVRILDSPDTKQVDKIMIFRDLIQFHNSAKEWFLETANFFSPFLLFKMLTFMIFLASNIFQLDLQVQHLGFSIGTELVACTVSLSNLLLYCLFGKLATESFENMADCLYESNWQDLPIDLQKYLILMIANAQIPLNYHGSGMIYLNLETFMKMLKTVLSYYMMFKAFTQ